MSRASFLRRRGPAGLLAVALGILPACSGGGGNHFVPVQPGPQASSAAPPASSNGANVVVSGTFSGSAPLLLARGRNHRISSVRGRDALTFDHIQVSGTLFPGDAGAYAITNTVNISVPSGSTYSASVPFSNVPVHDNEWAILDFAGVAKDGSTVEIGQLGGILNVGSSSTSTASLTAATTLTLQVFLNLLYAGAISTYDLDQTSALASTLTSDISATGAKTDPLTGLFDAPTLQTVYNDIAPKFERDLTVSTSPSTSGAITIVEDYTSAEEVDLANNGGLFFSSLPTGSYALDVQVPVIGNVIGASGCGGISVTTPVRVPENFPLFPSTVTACILQNATGSMTVRGVYGGHLIIGGTNYTYSPESPGLPSYTGGYVKTSGEAVGAFKETVDLAATEHEFTVSDPAGFAFFSSLTGQLSGLFTEQPYIASGHYSSTTFLTIPFTELETNTVTVPTDYSSTNDKIIVDSFNPWDLSGPDMEVCGGVTCYPINSSTSSTLSFSRPFQDPGTKLSYFDWTASGSLHSISSSAEGYSLDFSTSGAGTMTTKTPSVITPQEVLDYSGTLPVGTVMTITATDSANNTYTDSAVDSNGFEAEVTMSSVFKLVQTKSITITFTVPTSGTYIFQGLTDQCTYVGSTCD